MTIREFIELLKEYPKYYKIYDCSAENGMIEIKDEKGRHINTLFLEKILPKEDD